MFDSVLHLINQVGQQGPEADETFISRVILAVDGLSETKWATLPAKVRDWLNAAIKQVDSGNFSGLLETD